MLSVQMSVLEYGCDVADHKVTARPHTYTYLFDDGSASKQVKEKWEEEKAFSQQYFKDNVREKERYWLLCLVFVKRLL